MNFVRTNNFWFAVTIILILIDQLTKWVATHSGWSIFFNDQFAFSLPVPYLLMYAIYLAVLVGMSWYVFHTWHRFTNMQKYAWSFVYAGGLSNIFERIILGHVRDFIPVSSGMLNGADLFILVGLVLLLISNRYQKTNERAES